jgi:ADP-ribose pyrophosphatase YjhB (NUDIX family)
MVDNTITPQEAQAVPTCNNTSVGIIVWREGCLLLLERQKFPPGMACPAGHVEAGETYAQAAARELSEETGLVARSLRLLAEGDRFNRCRRPGGDWHHWQVFALAQRAQAYQAQLLSEDDWQAAPGLEIVWYAWLHAIGMLS